MKRSTRCGAGAGLAAVALVMSAGMSGLAGLSPLSATAASDDFVETFDDPNAMDRFRFQIHHARPFNGSPETWQGDHDENCGGPGTTRTIHLPPEGPDAGEAAYWCAPAGPGSGHMMTSFRTKGYAQVGFSPKQGFDHVGRVCWDQNMTDQGRKWTQMVVVPEATFHENDERLDYVKTDIQGPNRPGSKGVKLTEGVFLYAMRSGSTAVFTGQTIKDFDFRGYDNDDKKRRFTTCIEDLEDGRVRVELEREDHTEVRTLDGAFPDGPARVIFQDDTYNSTKETSPVPNPFTWHWDNILVSSDVNAKPPSTPKPPAAPDPEPDSQPPSSGTGTSRYATAIRLG